MGRKRNARGSVSVIAAIVTASLANVAALHHRATSSCFFATRTTHLRGTSYNSAWYQSNSGLRLQQPGRFWRSWSDAHYQHFASRQSLPSMQSQPNSSSNVSEHCIPTRGWLNQKVGSFSSPRSKRAILMTTNARRLTTVAIALTMLALVAGNAQAQCCGAATAAYAPAYTTAYAPAYTSYYAPAATGWYPGYFLDRIRARMWGSPSGYVAAAPTTYAASYAPAYTASYAPAYTASYAPAYTTSYAPSYETSYAPSGCASCQTGHAAAYAPASPCSSCCASHAPASSCCAASEPSGVTQASYQPQPACNCAATTYSQPPAPYSQPAAQQQNTASPPPQQQPQQQTTPLTPEPRPSIDPNQKSPTPDTTSNRPVESTSTPTEPNLQQPAQPAQPTSSHPEYDVKKNDNSTYLEAPKLFSPQDRTAKRNIAPVHNALYKQPAVYRQVATTPIVVTAEQSHKDAIGWTSASN